MKISMEEGVNMGVLGVPLGFSMGVAVGVGNI